MKPAAVWHMGLTAGTILGQYEIRSPLGAGGMGEVYRAHDTRLDRYVVIKVLPEYLTSDPECLRRFEQEARATAALSHPNILAVTRWQRTRAFPTSSRNCWKARPCANACGMGRFRSARLLITPCR